jgi:hypothetical protein
MGKNLAESKALGLCDQVDVHGADPPNIGLQRYSRCGAQATLPRSPN